METIVRKSLLNWSALGFYCVNHVQGCSHGCRYPCYAFMMNRGFGRVRCMEDWVRPKLAADAVGLLARELDRKREKPDRVHFCLTTDPFMRGHPEVAAASLDLIALVNSRLIPCSVLTKGLLPQDLADSDRFPSDNLYQISLVSLDEGFRARWEPGAPPYAERIAALKRLHELGRRTGAHIEPYPTPNLLAQDLRALLEAVGFVDQVFFGGWNYNAAVARFEGRGDFYGSQAEIVRRFCKERGMEYGA
jgi:DNA repair photolyase